MISVTGDWKVNQPKWLQVPWCQFYKYLSMSITFIIFYEYLQGLVEISSHLPCHPWAFGTPVFSYTLCREVTEPFLDSSGNNFCETMVIDQSNCFLRTIILLYETAGLAKTLPFQAKEESLGHNCSVEDDRAAPRGNWEGIAFPDCRPLGLGSWKGVASCLQSGWLWKQR